ncbi:NTF2-like domain [Cinara cedri]|uniref:NTF2-like domain n=1 Tax=Cinara cedri TaxID=506608 RepID=A0A5E4NQE6_9HEMI|nr:NTF2-like domain [Cinara cedri]
MNKREQLLFTMSAAEVGFRFAQHYNSMLSTNSQDAFMFYDENSDDLIEYFHPLGLFGNTRRICGTTANYGDGWTVQICVFRGLPFEQGTTLRHKNTDNHKPAETNKVIVSNDIANYNKPTHNTVNNKTFTVITTVKCLPKSISKRLTNSTEIVTISEPSLDTVNIDANYEITAYNTSINVKTSATEVGFRFAKRYYAVLTTKPENAYLFYDELGDYRTIYEDGTSVIAKNRKDLNSVLLNSMTLSDIAVKSITTEPCGGSLDELLITVIGIRFKHVFIVHYRPNRELHYAIVKSVKQYFPANRPSRVKTFDVGYNFEENI